MANQSIVSANPLVEPLTRRELDILKLLAQNLTDREIAERLTLALSSVKWYARQVYAKLAVENRHQAVQRAEEVGLLPRSYLSRPSHNLPRQISHLIGREKEIARVVELIREYPLVTLTGPGGVGKTRLALAAGEELLDDLANGVWFVEIAPLSDPLLVERTLADVLGVREDPNRSLHESLVRYLLERQALLIFDNCEHMLDACAALAGYLLISLPNLKVLVSSREPLGVTGEAVFRVPSLSFPIDEKTLEKIADFEAIRLFQERARAAQPDFQLDESSAPFVAQICRRLDGIPLAIELAGSRVAGLDVEHLAARLDKAFNLLSGGSRSALERHRTLRAAIDWSYNLLAEKERLLLRRLTVFVGGCTLEAAEAVCSGEAIQTEEILDLLFRLTNKSMLVVEPSRSGETRYRLLETIRQYAEDKQDDPEEIEQLRRKHCDWFVQFAEHTEYRLPTGERLVWKRKLDADIDNLRGALEWSLGARSEPPAGLRIINALAFYFLDQNPYRTEGSRWIKLGMAWIATTPDISSLLQARSLLSYVWIHCYDERLPTQLDQIHDLCKDLGEEGRLIEATARTIIGFVIGLNDGKLQECVDMLTEAETVLRQIGATAYDKLIMCLTFQEWVWSRLDKPDKAAACVNETEQIIELTGDIWCTMGVPSGQLAYNRGEYEQAQIAFEKAMDLIISSGIEPGNEIKDLSRKLGDAYRAQHKYGQALASYRISLEQSRDYPETWHMVWIACCFAFTEIDLGKLSSIIESKLHYLRAARILGFAEAFIEKI